MDQGPLRIVGEEGRGFQSRSEPRAEVGQIKPRLPTIQGIMVAVADERSDAGFGQPADAVRETELRTQAPIRRVVDVTGNQQRVDLLVKTESHDVVVRRKGGVAEVVGHMGGRGRSQSGERTVKVQIRGVHETEFRLGHVGRDAEGDGTVRLGDLLNYHRFAPGSIPNTRAERSAPGSDFSPGGTAV